MTFDLNLTCPVTSIFKKNTCFREFTPRANGMGGGLYIAFPSGARVEVRPRVTSGDVIKVRQPDVEMAHVETSSDKINLPIALKFLWGRGRTH